MGRRSCLTSRVEDSTVPGANNLATLKSLDPVHWFNLSASSVSPETICAEAGYQIESRWFSAQRCFGIVSNPRMVQYHYGMHTARAKILVLLYFVYYMYQTLHKTKIFKFATWITRNTRQDRT